MHDRAWAEESLREAGITEDRVGTVEYERAIRETLARALDSAIAGGKNSRTLRQSLADRQPSGLPLLTPEALHRWQERNRRSVSPGELAEAERRMLDGPSAECETCLGARFVRDPQWRPTGQKNPGVFPGAMPCPACSVEFDPDRLIAASNVPRVLRGLCFDEYEPRDGKRDALAAVQAWCDAVTARDDREAPSLLLHGAVGRGKTHLAISATLACCARRVRAEFWPWQDFLRNMQARFDQEGESAQDWEARTRDVPVLVLDDVGAEHSRSGWAVEVLEALIDHRQAHGLPTLITTNIEPEDLGTYAGARAASRLQRYELVEVGGIDMRAELTSR